jgi:hypothetical protein
MGFFVFVIGFFFQLTANFLYDDDAGGGTIIGQYILAWFSPVILAKGLLDIGAAQPGYSFGDIVDNTDKWPLIQVSVFVWPHAPALLAVDALLTAPARDATAVVRVAGAGFLPLPRTGALL